MAITVGSGLGGFTAIANQPTYGAAWVAPTKGLYFKSNKAVHDPHFVQGGPYLAGGRLVDIGSAHVKTYTDARGTLTGDFMNTGMALLLVTAFGSSGKLVQSGTTTAYELGGATGIKLEAPESHNEKSENGVCFDMQLGVPYTSAEQVAYNYRSCMIKKAEFVFDRVGLVSYSMDWDAQSVDNTEALITPTYTTNGVPFSMGNTSSVFQIGNPGGATTLAGVRKMTVTLERPLRTDRIYLGEEKKSIPVSNGLVTITVACEVDYTSAAKNVFKAFLGNEAQEIKCEAIGNAIGTSGKNDKFALTLPNVFIESGAEPPLDGPDLVKNTFSSRATINATNEAPVKAFLTTADTAF